MKIKVLITVLAFLLILPELTRAVCDASYETYRYKSALFHVSNAERIRVSVYNSMQDIYPRCFTAWIKVDGRYINLDSLPYSPSNWHQAWASTAPSCYGSGYRIVEGYSASAEYDLKRYVPSGYTGPVEVRVSSDCYEVAQVDPCFCWTVNVEVIETYQPTPLVQYCYLDIRVKDQYGNPLKAHVYVDSSYSGYDSRIVKQVLTGTHTVSASRTGYSSASKTVSCSCSETKIVELMLTSAQVCRPGEIRNRYCVCSTQVAYEKCKSDGSGWKTVIENCPSGYVCEGGYCVLSRPTCSPGYLHDYRCFGNWVQRKYIFSDCSTTWVNWQYCDYGCSVGACLPMKEPCRISLSVTTPSNVLVGDVISTTVRIKNSGDVGGYVSFDAYVCKTDPYCYQMSCDGYYGDPTVYVPARETRTLSCTVRAKEAGRYEVKVSYSGCGQSGNVYSGIFSIREKDKCVADYLNKFRCHGNWKQQLYRYSDCSTAWVYVEYCSVGCSNGDCLPKPITTTTTTTTTTTLPCPREEAAAPSVTPTGRFILSEAAWLVLIILLTLLIALIIFWLLGEEKFKRSKRRAEWFSKDC